jgi:outer membrane protein TolC
VSINIPWFNGKKYRAAEREAQGELSAAESDFVSAQTESLGLLRNQLQKIETLHHHLEIYSDNLLPTARQTVTSYQTDYEGDKATLLVLLSSQRDLRELETMYFQDLTERYSRNHRSQFPIRKSAVAVHGKSKGTGCSHRASYQVMRTQSVLELCSFLR